MGALPCHSLHPDVLTGADQLAVMERTLSLMETRPLLLALTDRDPGHVQMEALPHDHQEDLNHAPGRRFTDEAGKHGNGMVDWIIHQMIVYL